MKQMIRRILSTALVALSLLVCAATVVFWVRSYWRVDSLMLFRADRQWTDMWKDGSIGTFNAGRVYEADSRRGSLRLLYLYEQNSIYYRRLNPALWFSADEDALQPWAAAATHWPGVAIESRPVRQALPNADIFRPGDPPRPIAYTVHALYTPWALWTFLTALLPAWVLGHRLRRVRRLRRQSAGRCPHCSYNLTGNVSGACPECGRAVVPQPGVSK